MNTPTKREQNRQERQERVIQAAILAIAERGFADVRMSDIAERAGMTTGHVTYYFPSKTALLMLAIQESEEGLIAAAESELAVQASPWGQLERLIDLSIAREVGDSGWALWFHVWSEAVDNQEVAGIHHELDGRWRAVFSDVIQRGVISGEFRQVSATEVGTLISSALDGLSIQLALGAPGVDSAMIRRLALTLAHRLLDPPH